MLVKMTGASATSRWTMFPLRTFSLCEIIFCLAGSCHRLRVMATSGRFSRRSGQIVAELYRTKVYVAVV
jgi:hypothetical protein